jgi:hypothetical protein
MAINLDIMLNLLLSKHTSPASTQLLGKAVIRQRSHTPDHPSEVGSLKFGQSMIFNEPRACGDSIFSPSLTCDVAEDSTDRTDGSNTNDQLNALRGRITMSRNA